MKIFGREPALVISSIGSLVTLLVALNVPGVSAGTGAAITTFVTAAIIAVTTRPIAPALYTAVVAAGAALFTQYGLHVADGVVAAVSAVVLTGFALFGIRPRVSPAGSPATSPAAGTATSPAASTATGMVGGTAVSPNGTSRSQG